MHMRKLNIVGYLLFIAGVALIIMGIVRGESHVALFLIFPVIYGEGALSFLGILLIFIGIFLIFLSPIHWIGREHVHEDISSYPPVFPEESYTAEPELRVEPRKEKRYAGVILIGPIPIVIGSDKNMVMVALTVTIIFLVIFLLLVLYG